jgi:prepilin-type N-terminal cleavage/methylation domain-containing protein
MINKKIQSFTLIEILVVIVIVGILSSFIVVGMSSLTSNADKAKVQVWANGLKNSGLMSIVSEYKFEGPNTGTAQAADLVDSWGSNNGSTTAGPTIVASSSCALGKCLSFNGSTFVTVTDSASLALGTKMSAFIWIKGSTQTDDRGIFGQYNVTATAGYKSWIIATTTTALKVTLADSTGTSAAKTYISSQNICDNKWHYVGFTYNVDTLSLYIDGSNITPASTTPNSTMTTLSNSDRPISMGSYLTSSSNTIYNGFSGSLDNAIIFNEAVSMTEVQRQYFSGLNNLLAKGQITNNEYNERISLLNDSLGSK